MTKNAIEARAFKISLVTGLSTLLSVAFQFVSVSVCLKYWGRGPYGNWLALSSAYSLVRSIEAGFVSYVGNKLNYLYHQDPAAMQQHLASAAAGVVVTGAIEVALAAVAIFVNGAAQLFDLSFGSDHRAGIGLMILLSTWVVSGSYLGVVHRLLIPCGLMYQASWWAMAFQICQFAATILAAYWHFDLLQASLLFSAVQLVVYLASADYIRRKLPDYFPWWRGCRFRIGLADLSRSTLLTASSIVQQGATNGVVLLLSGLVGTAAVPAFSTVRTLANLWSSVTSVLTTPLLPDIVRFHAKSEGLKLALSCETYWIVVGSVVNCGILTTYPFIAPIYSFWTGRTILLNTPLLCALLGTAVVSNVGGLITTYLNGINSLGIILAAAAVRGILALLLGAILCSRLGLVGFGIGIFTGELCAQLLQARYFVSRIRSHHGVALKPRAMIPVTLSSLSVLVFLVCAGLGFWGATYVYFAAIAGVISAFLLGWTRLDSGVKARLSRLLPGHRSSKTLE